MEPPYPGSRKDIQCQELYKLRNLDFQAESPQTMPHNNDNDISIIKTILIYFYSLGFSLNARLYKRQRFNHHRVEI